MNRTDRTRLHDVPLRAALIGIALILAACTPTVRVAADDPITINLNVNIQHDIRVRVERDLDDLFSDSGVF
ncbi:MAG: YnbE family lipoprotein [Gammaproteobacteria bacterium]|nr:MAG: YnbE family lipoprotein [Gammaproteobacteria bacterium]